MKRYILNKIVFPLVLSILILLPSCSNDFLTENPKTAISEATFWKNEKDAMRGLTGCYTVTGMSPGACWGPYAYQIQNWSNWTDESTCMRTGAPSHWPLEGLYSTERQVEEYWEDCYDKISRANYFLDNIGNVEMDEAKKAEITAEARFLRANWYFWLTLVFGDVPLARTTLTFKEANSISRTAKSEVTKFILDELSAAAADLPAKRPSSQHGRAEKGAALATKARLLMAEKKWSEAAVTYKQIMDLNRYIIVPTFEECFEDEGDFNDETIWGVVYIQDELPNSIGQFNSIPGTYGGNNHIQVFQSFVDKYWMIDGKTIHESPLYDPDNPFDNRDPRLYRAVTLPGYSVFRGKMFQGHPDSLYQYGQMGPGASGYGFVKNWDLGYTGPKQNYGGDVRMIRYAEVLLGRLESELEAGTVITQSLLDATINKVRQREAVNMPSVTTTNQDELREIVRNERAIELAFEGGIRYFDLLRWDMIQEACSGKFYGMKMTDDPANYTGSWPINSEGHLYIEERDFKDYYKLWPIPLGEMDINENMVQNPGYE